MSSALSRSVVAPSLVLRWLAQPGQSQLQQRSISSSTSPAAPSSWPSSSSPASTSSSRPISSTPSRSGSTLTWDRYLTLRKQRRLAGVVTTVPSTVLAAITSGSYFLTQEIDPTNMIAGIDPVYVYALLTLSCTGLGYLVGPTLGASLWSVFHSKQRKEMEEKDRDFFAHIVARRVDPSRQTMQNRLPDYYGEKIGSIKDYRQWLRDQAVYRRKAAHGVDSDEKTI